MPVILQFSISVVATAQLSQLLSQPANSAFWRPKHERSYRSLGGIGVEFHASVIEKECQSMPARQSVAHRVGRLAFGVKLGRGLMVRGSSPGKRLPKKSTA